MEYLEFEMPIKELQDQLQKCQIIGKESEVDVTATCNKINKKLTEYNNKALFQFLLSIMSHLKIDEHYFPEP